MKNKPLRGRSANIVYYDEAAFFSGPSGALPIYQTDPNHGSSSSSKVYMTKQVVEDFRQMVKKAKE